MGKTVDAAVVESDELVITRMEPGAAIEANFDALKASIARIVDGYKDVVVTHEMVPQAKRDRAYLNSVSKSLNQRRLDVKKRYMAPIEAFESRVKELDAPLKEAAAVLDAQVKAFEERERIEKREECRKHYEDFAGALVDAVPYERIEDPAWLLKTTNLMSAFQAIEDRVEAIARDDQALDDLSLSHPIEAHAEYFATLSLSAAIARSKALDEQERIAAEMEIRKAEVAAERAKPPAPEPAPEPVAEAASVSDTWHIVVTCTREELDALLAALKVLGISGTVRRG